MNGALVHEITSIGTDQWNSGGMPANWLANEFTEAMLGWQSFSSNNIDVWMDDVIFSTSPVGCE